MLWIAVSADHLETPFAVAETGTELARMLKTKVGNIYKRKSKQHNGKICGYRVMTVDVSEEEDAMKYSILESFQKYLQQTMNQNTARKYYSAVKGVLKDADFESLEEVDPEYIKARMKELPTKNEFSAAKRGLIKLQEFDPGIQLPEEEFFKEQSKKKRNYVKSRGRKIYKDTTIRKIDRVKDPDLRLAYRLEMISGLRISEIAGLKPEDIDLSGEHMQIFVQNGKGGKSGLVACLDDGYVKARLEQLLKMTNPGDQLFYGAGYMMNEANRLGFECHDLRRIFAQDMEAEQMEKGKSRQEAGEVVREALRHENIRTTNIYLRDRPVIRGRPGDLIGGDAEERGS